MTMTERTVLYLSEMQPGRRRAWWPGVPERCPACSPAGLLALEEPSGWLVPGRLVCLNCGREPYEVQRSPLRIARGAYEAGVRGRPPKQRDYHPTTPCRGDGCGNEIRVRYKTGLCRRCLDANGRRGLP